METQNRKQRRTAEALSRRKGGENKSAAPQAEAAGDNGWDDLIRLHAECQALSVTPSQVLPLLKDQEALSQVKDTSTLVQQASVLQKDVMEYKTRLEAIYSKHSQRTGSTQSPDELMYVLTLGEEYQEWMHSYQSVVIPVVQTILEHFANEKLEGDYIPATTH